MTSYRDIVDRLERDERLDSEIAAHVREALAARLGEGEESRLIAAVAGIGAWVAAFFIVGFLLVLGIELFDGVGLLVYTVVFGGVAMALHHVNAGEGVFASQAALAASASAQTVVPIATFESSMVALVIAQIIVSATLYASVSSRANRVLSALIAFCVVAVVGIDQNIAVYVGLFGVCAVLAALVFGRSAQLSWRVRRHLRPAAYVAATMSLLLSIEPVLREFSTPFASEATLGWILRGVAGVVALGVVASRAVDDSEFDLTNILLVTGGIAVIGGLTSAGIFVSLLLAGLGFWKLDRILIVLGGLGLAGHLSTYYYLLEISLLHKSIALMASGLALLGIRWWYARSVEEDT
jgi:hypothetical protein